MVHSGGGHDATLDRVDTGPGDGFAQAVREARVTPADLAELMGAFNDVTVRLQATHQQLHAEVARLNAELRSANEQIERSRRLAALGEMAAGIAHEVRNPLGSIRLYSRMLVEDLTDRPAERQTVEKIDRAAVGLAAIVEDLLTFAREFKIRRSVVEADELFECAVQACREDLPGGLDAVTLAVDVPGAVALEVDRGLVVRALVNLIRNAVQAMGEAGSTRRRITLAAAADGPGAASLVVRDTGPGIPTEVAARMFNPFFTTRQTGTGLGLAIVHRIVEAHGGSVSVRNAPAGGAEVELRLPTPGAAPTEDPHEVSIAAQRRVHHVSTPGQDAPASAEVHE
ncbi:MAG: hypothetical protein AMXMBFR58_09960 [Phycisphaerae bacterium]